MRQLLQNHDKGFILYTISNKNPNTVYLAYLTKSPRAESCHRFRGLCGFFRRGILDGNFTKESFEY